MRIARLIIVNKVIYHFFKNSIKNIYTILNNYYNNEHIVDTATYNFLNNLLTGEIATFSKKEHFAKYPSIQAAFDSSNLPLKSLVLTVVKNIQENIVYVFTLSNTTTSERCGIQDGSIIIKDLALFARKRL